jgi:hypothetical protein
MQSITSYLSNKSPWLYIPLWLVFLWLYVQILGFQAEDSHNLILSGLYFIEFGVHEVSHVIASFLPSIFVAAAGSIGEITFTILIVVAAIKGKAYFAAVFGSIWVMLAMNSAGRYMADARSMLLPLVSFGDNAKHDWNYVFGQLGWLKSDTAIGGTLSMLGNVIGALGLLFGLYLIVNMIMAKLSVRP